MSDPPRRSQIRVRGMEGWDYIPGEERRDSDRGRETLSTNRVKKKRREEAKSRERRRSAR